MKKLFILFLVLIFVISMMFIGTACKEEAAPAEETVEEATEEVAEEAAPAEETVEEAVEVITKDEPLNIVLWADALNPALESLFERFTADTGWSVEFEPLPGGPDYSNLVPTRLAAGEGPDLLWGHGTFNEYIIYNPVDNFVDITDWNNENMYDTKINGSLVEVNAIDGKTYGIPINCPTLRGYYYNKNILEEVGVELPTSCQDFLDNVAPKIKVAGYDPIYGMGQDQWAFGFEADNFVADEFVSTDIQEKINNNEATFADSAYLRAFEWQKAIYDAEFYNDDVLVGTYDGAVQAVTDGTAFMTMMSVGTMGRFTDETHEYLGGLNLSEEGNRAYYSLPHYLYIVSENAGGDNPEAAMAFFEWFIGEENLIQFYSEMKAPSVYIGIENEMYSYAQDLKAAFDAQTPYVSTLRAAAKMTGVYSSGVAAGTLTTLEACEQMQTDFAASAKAVGLEAY